MMGLTVRYPDGTGVTFNNARKLYYGIACWELYTRSKDEGGTIVVSIQPTAGVSIEFVEPCRVTRHVGDAEQAVSVMLDVARERSTPYWGVGHDLAELKRRLKDFNATTRTWNQP